MQDIMWVMNHPGFLFAPALLHYTTAAMVVCAKSCAAAMLVIFARHDNNQNV